jgi:hypothetical protein
MPDCQCALLGIERLRWSEHRATLAGLIVPFVVVQYPLRNQSVHHRKLIWCYERRECGAYRNVVTGNQEALKFLEALP